MLERFNTHYDVSVSPNADAGQFECTEIAASIQNGSFAKETDDQIVRETPAFSHSC